MNFHFDAILRRFSFLRRASASRFISACRRGSTDAGGSTAIEFSMLLFPFLALIFFIMEVGLQLFITSVLDNAIRTASRQLQVGVAHTENMSGEEFKNSICKKLPIPSACDNLILSVTQLKSWTDVTGRYGGFNDRRLDTPTKDEFCLANEKTIVLVRSFLKLPVISGLWLVSDPNGTGDRGVTANHVFRMEPIGDSTSSSACSK
jgi:hypothetical protein